MEDNYESLSVDEHMMVEIIKAWVGSESENILMEEKLHCHQFYLQRWKHLIHN